MKKIMLPLVVIATTFMSYKTTESTVYKAIIEDTIVTWAGSRPGKTHDGTLQISEGTLIFEDDKLVGGDFTLDMNSIVVLDIKSKSSNKKLVDHFKSNDFFDVANHPTGVFKITNSEAKDGKTLVKGNLTIKGISNEVSFLADVTSDGTMALLQSEEFKIDRTKWDIKFRSGSYFDGLKNKLIYDDITISVNVAGKK